MRAAINRTVTRILTSPRLRDWRRLDAALARRLRHSPPIVHYFHQSDFHQSDDPCSVLAAQTLRALTERYAIELRVCQVAPPVAAVAPDAPRLREYAARDAERLGRAYDMTSGSRRGGTMAMPMRPRHGGVGR